MSKQREMITVVCEESGLVTQCSRRSLEVMDAVSKLALEDQRRFLKMLRSMKQGAFRHSMAEMHGWGARDWQAAVDSLP